MLASAFLQPRQRTNRWTGATGSEFRIIIGPAQLLGHAVARSTQTFGVTPQMDLVQRQRQFNGFRQVWTERTDGVFHGLYTVFWETGDVPCMQGDYKDGVQEGIWTYWDRNGVVERQVHFANDEEIDSRNSPPWFSSVELR